MPIAVYGNNEVKINELKEFGSKKRSELVDLGMIIAERKILVRELYEDFYGSATQEDKDAAGAFSNKVQTALVQRQNIAAVVTNEFEDGLDDWKIFIIRVIAEKLYVENLITQYAECFQAIIDTDKALDELQESGIS